MTQWVGQQGAEASATGSNPSFYLQFLTLLIRLKIVIPPLICMEVSDNGQRRGPNWDRRVPLRSFLVLWDKKFRPNHDTPLLCINCFDTRNFVKHRRFPLPSFPVLWDKVFDRKSWYSPLMRQMFRYQKLCETQKVSPTKFSGTVRQNLLHGKLWYFLRLMHENTDTRVFLKHRRILIRIFLVLWVTKCLTENRDTSSFA